MPDVMTAAAADADRAVARGEATVGPPDEPSSLARPVTRRAALAGAAAVGLAPAAILPRPSIAAEPRGDGGAPFAALDQRIREGMASYAIPGAAVGVLWRGRSFLRGYGFTDLSNPQPVDADTLFRIASVTKPFTGTAAMRLVDQGWLVLDQRVDSYVDGFVAPAGAQSVTVRQLLDHSVGWLGDDFHDTGSDDGALARFVDDLRDLPQLTPVGQVFSYNNAAIDCAGRVVEALTGLTYEAAVEQLVARPLGLSRTRFAATPDGLDNLAMPHTTSADGTVVVNPAAFLFPRANEPSGGLLSSVRDLLAFAAFHLGDGRAADGSRVMSTASLRGMWSRPGPGGTLTVELIGMGVSWSVRPTAEGVVVVEHGGDGPGYRQELMLVPAKQFAIALLTNGDGGTQLRSELFYKDWVLRHFTGLSNLPAPPRSLSASELTQYEGRFEAETITADKQLEISALQLTGRADGTLHLASSGSEVFEIPTFEAILTFYADDYVIDESTGLRASFLHDGSGAVAWLRFGGRLYRRVGT